MQLTITDSNFYSEADWLFKVKDEENNIFFIFDNDSYKKLKLRSPVTKKQLDHFDKGTIIRADVKDLSGTNVVIAILE